MTLTQLEDAVSPLGLTLGNDLAACGTCSVGSMVARNAGGGEAFRNGVMRQWVFGLEVVLPDAAVMNDLKKVIKTNEGYEMKKMFIGSEGTLGIFTGFVLKLEPAIRDRQTILAYTHSAVDSLSYFHRLRAAFGPKLLSVEIMWDDYFKATSHGLGLDGRFGHLDGETYFIADIDVPADDDSLLEILGKALETGEITDAVIAKND